MRILVTGGAGFIGSHLVRLLLSERPDADVINLDALTYAGNPDNLQDVTGNPRYTFVHGDIADAAMVRGCLRGVDVLINVAAESHVDRSIASAAPFIHTNVGGTETLLSAALEAGVDRFVQVSTDEVYGELPWRDPEAPGAGERFTEATPLDPRSPYAASKAAGDLLVQAFHCTHGLDTVITRCSNNYGPHQFPEKLIPLAITRLLDGGTVPIYGDGLYVRDWIHVEDHCRGILAAVTHGSPGRVYNFGAHAERTNLDLVRTLLALLGCGEDRLEYVTDRPGHDRRYGIDPSRSERELHWRARVPLEEGLARTVDWYRTHVAWSERVRSGAYRDGVPSRPPTGPPAGIELAPDGPGRPHGDDGPTSSQKERENA